MVEDFQVGRRQQVGELSELLLCAACVYALICMAHLPILDRPARWCVMCRLYGLTDENED